MAAFPNTGVAIRMTRREAEGELWRWPRLIRTVTEGKIRRITIETETVQCQSLIQGEPIVPSDNSQLCGATFF
jgi:hypothetical protein